jgi:ribosome-binding factor A
VLGSPEERESSLAGLRSSHGVLQAKIASGMRMKRTPTLTFEYYESLDRGDRISRLLDDE